MYKEYIKKEPLRAVRFKDDYEVYKFICGELKQPIMADNESEFHQIKKFGIHLNATESRQILFIGDYLANAGGGDFYVIRKDYMENNYIDKPVESSDRVVVKSELGDYTIENGMYYPIEKDVYSPYEPMTEVEKLRALVSTPIEPKLLKVVEKRANDKLPVYFGIAKDPVSVDPLAFIKPSTIIAEVVSLQYHPPENIDFAYILPPGEVRDTVKPNYAVVEPNVDIGSIIDRWIGYIEEKNKPDEDNNDTLKLINIDVYTGTLQYLIKFLQIKI